MNKALYEIIPGYYFGKLFWEGTRIYFLKDPFFYKRNRWCKDNVNFLKHYIDFFLFCEKNIHLFSNISMNQKRLYITLNLKSFQLEGFLKYETEKFSFH